MTKPICLRSIRDFRFHWLGLVGFADPLRAGVADAVVEAHAAGIRLIMLTGDHLETARAIALQAGLAAQSEVALGRELDELDEQALARRVAGINVFARVRPEHKLRLVNALKDSGEVVAMTGDGVNDAPALMAAHVGIAMGGRGTDVAREAASIVLLDDNFVTVVHAIRRGRSIYDNILRAVRYIIAVHVPITGLALLPMFTGGPLVLLPLHIVFLELIIDPACSIVFEREAAAADIMRRPPRPPKQPLLGLRALLTSLGHGGLMFAVVVAVYALGHFILLPGAAAGRPRLHRAGCRKPRLDRLVPGRRLAPGQLAAAQLGVLDSVRSGLVRARAGDPIRPARRLVWLCATTHRRLAAGAAAAAVDHLPAGCGEKEHRCPGMKRARRSEP